MNKIFTLEELAVLTGAKLVGNGKEQISSVNSLESAGTSDATFLANPRYKELLKTTKASVICVDEKTSLIEGKNFLITENPSQIFQKITDLLLPPCKSGFKGIHPSAVIHESTVLEEGVSIGPNVTIDRDCKIGKNTHIHANVAIGAETEIGENCILYSGCFVRERCILKNRVILQPGAIIGSCGFGYLTENGRHIKIEQMGNVILEDDVEIGANTTVDRARFKSTIIKKGTKIDNLVQIGHNVILGEHNIIVAQTGISGSSKTGKYVIMGGQVGVVGHVEIADFAQIATRGGVSKNVTKPGQYGGTPLMPFQEFNKNRVHLRNIEKYVKRIEELEEKLKELEKKLS